MKNPFLSSLDTSTPFNKDQDKEHSQLLSQAQWAAINSINDKYTNRIVPGTNNRFRDHIWARDVSEDFVERQHEINWNRFSNLQDPAMLLLAKHNAFKSIELGNNNISTVKKKTFFINALFGYVNHKNILKGDAGNLLVGLYALTTRDIENLIDNKLASGTSFKTAHLWTDGIDDLKFSTGFFKDDYPFLYLDCAMPWGRGHGKPKWLNERFINLGIIPPAKEYYAPFSQATSMMLVERSMEILDNYADKAVELFSEGSLFGETKNGKPKHRYSSEQRRLHATKYKGVFDEIVELKLNNRGAVLESFYSNLFRVVQGAMFNIMLFTTGIRNLDARLLRVGCCLPSEVESLFYISTDLKKTNNSIDIPVPYATYCAVKILEKMRFGESGFLLARYYLIGTSNLGSEGYTENYKYNISGVAFNNTLQFFANHFNIPFIDDDDNLNSEATAHRYRATTAGWLASASNLSVILVRRLFGHTNSVMPLSYLQHNKHFVNAIEDIKSNLQNEVSSKLTEAVSEGKIGGIKGRDLLKDFRYMKGKSQSLTEAEARVSFRGQLKERIIDEGQMIGYMTPLAVICGHNPKSSGSTPCAESCPKMNAPSKKTDWVHEQIIKSKTIQPDYCVGNRCPDAIVGDWSIPLRDSFIWYAQLLKGMHGDRFTDEHYKQEAKSFIRQYAEDMKAIFGLEVDDA